METEGPHSDNGRTKGPPGSNVVPFPRDWLGPRDELVPFGERSDYRTTTRTADEDRAAPEKPPKPRSAPTAADFWGEEAASLHDALQAPEQDRAVVHEAPEIRHGGRPRGVRQWRRRASYSTGGVGSTSLGAAAKAATASPAARRLYGFRASRARVAAVLGVAALSIAVVAAIATGSSRHPSRPRPTRAPGRVTIFAGLVSGTETDLSAIRKLALHRWPPPRSLRGPAGRPRAHHTAAAPPAVVSSEPPTSASGNTPVAASTSAATTTTADAAASASSGYAATADTATSPQPVSSPPPSAGTTTASPTTTGARSGSSNTRPPSGSSNPGSQAAFGANGTLGPGSSPNG